MGASMSEQSIYNFDNDDDGMLHASETARRTFKFFWRELSWERRRIVPGLDLSAVKMPFKNEDRQEDEPEFEHMWITEIEFDGDIIQGRLLNNAQWIDSLTAGAPATIALEDISDWMYVCQGEVCGAFTVNYIRGAMSRQERAAHDQAWGLKFGEPEVMKLVPARHVSNGGLLKRLFGSKPEPQSISNMERTEHPMSENMAEMITESLSSHPLAASEIDDDGWSMLHRDSLAGNLTPVRILVEHGADYNLKTPSGYNAVDLAHKMGWPNIVEYFENISKVK